MKKVLVDIVLFIACLVLYWCFWTTAMQRAESHFLAALEKWRHEQQGRADITYTALKRYGFPFRIGLAMVNPHFSATDIAKADLDGSVRVSVPFILGKEASIDLGGAFTLEHNYWERHKELQWQGSVAFEQRADNLPAHFDEVKRLLGDTLYGPPATPADCEIHATLQHLAYKEFSGMEQQASLSAGAVIVDVTKQGSKESQNNISYNVELQGMRADLKRRFSDKTLDGAIWRYGTFQFEVPTNLQLVGAVSLPPPDEWNRIPLDIAELSGNRTLDFQIHKLTIENDLYTGFLRNFVVTCQQKGPLLSFTYRGETEFTATELYDVEAAKALTAFLQAPGFLDGLFPAQPKRQQIFLKHLPKIVDLFPKAHPWGKVDRDIEIQATMELGKNPQGLPKLQKINVEPLYFKFQAIPYAAQLEGKMGEREGNLSLTIRNYQQLIKEMTVYNNKIAKLVKLLKDPRLPFWATLNEKKRDQLLVLISSLGKDASSDDPNLILEASYGPEGIKIGEMPLLTLAGRLVQLFTE